MKPRYGPGVEALTIMGLGLASIYLALLPLSLAAQRFPAPDLAFCIVAAWVIRRPETASFWIVLALGALGDVLLARPVGLGALALLLAAEVLRARAGFLRGVPFMVEWVVTALVFAAMAFGMDAVLHLAFLEGARLGTLLGFILTTALCYPPVVAILALGLGLRTGRRGRDDRLGRIP